MDTALAYLYRAAQAEPAALPRLTLVDLKLTNGNGVELIRRLRANRQLDCMPVLMLTTSDNPTDVRAAFAAGANAYVIKPSTFEELVGLTNDICRFWLHWNHSTPNERLKLSDGNPL